MQLAHHASGIPGRPTGLPRCYQRPFIAATSAASPDASRHGGRAARSVPRATARARQAENLPRLRTSRTLNAIDDYAQPVAPNAQDLGPATAACGAAAHRTATCATDAPHARCVIAWTFCYPATTAPSPSAAQRPRGVVRVAQPPQRAHLAGPLGRREHARRPRQKNGGMAHDDLDRYPRSRVTNYLRQASCTPARYRTATSTLNRSRLSRLSSASSRPRTASSCGCSPAGSSCGARDNDLAADQLPRPQPRGRATDLNRRRPNELPRRSQSQPGRSRSAHPRPVARHRTVDPPHRPGLHHLGGAAATRLAADRSASPAIGREQPLADDDRWQQLRRCIRDPEMPLRLRVAGSFVLLYGHPVSRVAAMRPHQVEEDANGVYLVIGSHRALLRPRSACSLSSYATARHRHRSSDHPRRPPTGSSPDSCRPAPRRQLPGQTAQRRRHPNPNRPQRRADQPRGRPPGPDPRRSPRAAHQHRRPMGPPLQARLGDLRRGPGRSSLAGAHRRVRSTLALLPLMDMDAETSSTRGLRRSTCCPGPNSPRSLTLPDDERMWTEDRHHWPDQEEAARWKSALDEAAHRELWERGVVERSDLTVAGGGGLHAHSDRSPSPSPALTPKWLVRLNYRGDRPVGRFSRPGGPGAVLDATAVPN